MPENFVKELDKLVTARAYVAHQPSWQLAHVSILCCIAWHAPLTCICSPASSLQVLNPTIPTNPEKPTSIPLPLQQQLVSKSTCW